MRHIFFMLTALTLSFPTSAFSMSKPLPLATVSYVDLSQYLGKWYEIARLPQSFEKDCVGVTANYATQDDGQISVLNTCIEGTLDGKIRSAKGSAKVVDKTTNAKLKVTFFWPFYGDYWILELGPQYEYAVVGSPDRKTFWVLSRTPKLDEALLNSIIERFSAQGFDLGNLYRTPQS